MSGDAPALAAFTGCGIELEYMIVERGNLSPLPIADQLLRTVTDPHANDVDRGMLVLRDCLQQTAGVHMKRGIELACDSS